LQLTLSEGLIQDLEKLDDLHERDCYIIEVYYLESVQDTPDNLSRAPEMYCKDFESFIWSLGWAIDLSTHPGFKGNVTPSMYPKLPYYANMNSEIIFKIPYLLKMEGISHDEKGKSSSGIFNDDNDFPNRVRSVTLENIPAIKETPIEQDIISIAWLEDIHNINHLILQLQKHVIGCVMVHPLPNSGGLYYIRIILKTGIPDDCIVIAF
jgi:hypothetical protein